MRHILSAAAALVFVPLLLALLFLMPVEFCAASWHLWRADSITTGTVLSSQEKAHRGNLTRSVIQYTYSVNGRSHESNRVQAGWISDKSYESSGGDLAKSLSPGSQVVVHFDPAHPEFALLEYGWPKWSVGVTLFVWGMWLGSYVFGSEHRRPKSHLLFGLTRGTWILGFLIIFLLPPTLEPKQIVPLAESGLVLALLAALYSRVRYAHPS